MSKLQLKKKDSFAQTHKTSERMAAGLDIHKHYITVSLVINNKKEYRRYKTQEFQSNPDALLNICRFLRKYPLELIVMEATGVYTPPVYNFLRKYNGWGLSKPLIHVVNPSMIRKYPGEIHKDTLDSFLLGKLGLLGLTSPSYLPNDKMEELRRLSREIQINTQECTKIKTRIKRILSQWGFPLPNFDLNHRWVLDLCRAMIKCGGSLSLGILAILNKEIKTSSYTIRALNSRIDSFIPFSNITLPQSINMLFKGYLANLAMNQSFISLCIKQIEEILDNEPKLSYDIWRLSKIPGIDEKTATIICSEIGDIQRFPSIKQFLSYAGAATTIYQSGISLRKGHLNKRVNKWLKTCFYQTGKIICTIVRKDSNLKTYGKSQLKYHQGKPRLAYANTGIKVARIIYMILKHDRLYDPFYIESSSSETRSDDSNKKHKIQLKELRRRTNIYIKFMMKMLDEFDGQDETIKENFRSLWQDTAVIDILKA